MIKKLILIILLIPFVDATMYNTSYLYQHTINNINFDTYTEERFTPSDRIGIVINNEDINVKWCDKIKNNIMDFLENIKKKLKCFMTNPSDELK